MIKKLDNSISNRALNLLNLFAFMHFDGITEEIFQRSWIGNGYVSNSDWMKSFQLEWLTEGIEVTCDSLLFREAVGLLASFSLITYGLTNVISMHPLLHDCSRFRLDGRIQKHW
jgi:hypothetical protein